MWTGQGLQVLSTEAQRTEGGTRLITEQPPLASGESKWGGASFKGVNAESRDIR